MSVVLASVLSTYQFERRMYRIPAEKQPPVLRILRLEQLVVVVDTAMILSWGKTKDVIPAKMPDTQAHRLRKIVLSQKNMQPRQCAVQVTNLPSGNSDVLSPSGYLRRHYKLNLNLLFLISERKTLKIGNYPFLQNHIVSAMYPGEDPGLHDDRSRRGPGSSAICPGKGLQLPRFPPTLQQASFFFKMEVFAVSQMLLVQCQFGKTKLIKTKGASY